MSLRIRRMIITICILLLLPNIISLPIEWFRPELSSQIKEQMAQEDIRTITLNEKVEFEHCTFHLKNILFLEESTFLHFNTKSSIRGGWSFSHQHMTLTDDRGKVAEFSGAGATSTTHKKVNRVSFEPLHADTEYIIVKIELFDRFVEKKIPLLKEGRNSEG